MRMKLKYAASLASLFVMGSCGVFVSWQLRHQIYHATPPAIFLACATSSLLSALFGWKLSGLYIRYAKIGFLLFPLAVLALTSFSTAIVYYGSEPLFRDWGYLHALQSQFKYVYQYAILYVLMSIPVWLVGWALATILLRKLAQSLRI